MPKHVPDHWDELGRQLRTYAHQLTEKRLMQLYQKLYSEGWAESPPMPLSTRNADQRIKSFVMHAVTEEMRGRERQKFVKMHRRGSITRRLADALPPQSAGTR